MRAVVAFFVLAALATLLLFAAETGELRPTADGSSDWWINKSAAGCQAVNCYTEVDETSGSYCTATPSDGDSTYIKSQISSADNYQTFHIDESSIPDGSTVESVKVSVCAKRNGTTGYTFNLVVRINSGTLTDGSAKDATDSWADFNDTFTFTDLKKSSSDEYEIGVKHPESSSYQVYISAIKSVWTYTTPAGVSVQQPRVAMLFPTR